MRKTCSSSKCWCTTALSSRAVARSVPNGFSMITRRQRRRLRLRQARGAKLLDDGLVDAGRDGEIEQHPLGTVDLVETGLDALRRAPDRRSRRRRSESGARAMRDLVVPADLRELAQAVLELLAERVVGHLRAADADDREPRRQPLTARQVVERRQQLPLGQIARRAEDDERRRTRGGFDPEVVAERVDGRHCRLFLIIEERTEKDSNHSELKRMGVRAVECRHWQPISPEVTETRSQTEERSQRRRHGGIGMTRRIPAARAPAAQP